MRVMCHVVCVTIIGLHALIVNYTRSGISIITIDKLLFPSNVPSIYSVRV
jgi:hypothetical protein